jgi:hypothetical protein
MPCEWEPQRVVDPSTGEVFTDASAWEFIATRLDEGDLLEETILRVPAETAGYVLKVALDPGRPTLYVKLQLGRDCVIGRSFHYSKVRSRSLRL